MKWQMTWRKETTWTKKMKKTWMKEDEEDMGEEMAEYEDEEQKHI